MSLTTRSAFAFLVVVVGIAVGACESFQPKDESGTPDPLATVAKRDLSVTVDWPANANLDPAKDPRISKIKVSVGDVLGGGRIATVDAQKDQLGPYGFPQFESSDKVNVIIEVRGADDRLIGYGRALNADVSQSTTIMAVVRKRILYAVRGDGTAPSEHREVVAMNLAPTDAEPTVSVADEVVADLPWATAVVLTGDGRLLAVSHAPTPTTGAVAVYETGTHASTRVVDVGFVPAQMIGIGDGNEVLVMPSGFSTTTAMKRVNVVTGEVKDAASGLMGGALDVTSATSFDGSFVVFVGNHRPSIGAPTKPYLLAYNVRTSEAGAPVPIDDLDRVTAVRYSFGAGEILVAGCSGPSVDDCTGKIVSFTPGRATPTVRTTFAEHTSSPSSIVVHPLGQRTFISSDLMYPGNGRVGGTFYVFDKDWKSIAEIPPKESGQEFGVWPAIRLPYEPRRVLGGQSDPSNNYHGAIVELPADGTTPTEILVTGYTSSASLVSFATPFGQPL